VIISCNRIAIMFEISTTRLSINKKNILSLPLAHLPTSAHLSDCECACVCAWF